MIVLQVGDIWTPTGGRHPERNHRYARTIILIQLLPTGEIIGYANERRGDLCTCSGVCFRDWISKMRCNYAVDAEFLESLQNEGVGTAKDVGSTDPLCHTTDTLYQEKDVEAVSLKALPTEKIEIESDAAVSIPIHEPISSTETKPPRAMAESRTRDGHFSVAAIELQRNAPASAERIEWEDVLPWIAANKMKLNDYSTKGDLLTAVNQTRARFNLPLWYIVEGNKVIRGKVAA